MSDALTPRAEQSIRDQKQELIESNRHYNTITGCPPGQKLIQCVYPECQKWFCGYPNRLCCDQECGYLHQFYKTGKAIKHAGRNFRLSTVQMRDCTDGYKKGKNLTALASELQINIELIKEFLFDPITMANHNVVQRRHSRPNLKPEERQAIYDMEVVQKKTRKEICEIFGITSGCVTRVVKAIASSMQQVHKPFTPLRDEQVANLFPVKATTPVPMTQVVKPKEDANQDAIKKLDTKPQTQVFKKSVLRRLLNYLGLDYYENRRIQPKS